MESKRKDNGVKVNPELARRENSVKTLLGTKLRLCLELNRDFTLREKVAGTNLKRPYGSTYSG